MFCKCSTEIESLRADLKYLEKRYWKLKEILTDQGINVVDPTESWIPVNHRRLNDELDMLYDYLGLKKVCTEAKCELKKKKVAREG